MSLSLPGRAALQRVKVAINGRPLSAKIEAKGGKALITLASDTLLVAGQTLRVQM